jgi:hypothetical protein
MSSGHLRRRTGAYDPFAPAETKGEDNFNNQGRRKPAHLFSDVALQIAQCVE